MSTRSRRLKWYPTPPPPSPKIINLPRRRNTRRKKPRNNVNRQPISATTTASMIQTCNYKGKLESLFGEEREFTRAPVVLLSSAEKRERVQATAEVEEEEDDGGGQLAEEKWRFQAEILRAECNFLRMERKLALKKLERNRIRIERTLKSALQNLASGRKKLCEGKNMESVLEEEMKELAEKLEELQSSYNGSKDRKLRRCKNFDKKASCLQQRLEKLRGLSDDDCNKEIKAESRLLVQSTGDIDEDSSFLDCKSQAKSTDVEMLKGKIEGLSKGILDRMILSSTANSSVASSASTSKRSDFPDHTSFSNRYSNHMKEPSISHEANNKCSGRCKVLVRRIVEQVRAETEQWSQMQEMLGQLRQEMEELQTSKDFWESQALAATDEIRSLHSSVEEWRGKAIDHEKKAKMFQTEVALVKGELEKLKNDQAKEVASTPQKTMLSLGKQLQRETKNGLSCRMKGECDISVINRQEKLEQSKKSSQPLSLGKQLAREKRILISRSKENRPGNNELPSEGRRKGYNLVRSPFKDIGNSSSSTTLVRQNSNAIFPLHCPDPARMEDSP